MAQLRQDYDQFVERGAEILVVCPEDQAAVAQYWQKEQLPFVGLADPKHEVADQYGQETKLLKFGRLPTLVVVDKGMNLVHSHHGVSMRDIPQSQPMLDLLDDLNAKIV